MSALKLNVGCGRNWEEYKEFEGVDIVDFGQKYVLDITEDGLVGIADESVEEIMAFSVLEHIPPEKIIFVMNECHRVLKHLGLFHIKVPNAPHPNAFHDPTHRSFWTYRTFKDYFAGRRPRNADYGIEKWEIDPDGEGGYRMWDKPHEIEIYLRKGKAPPE